MSQTNVEIAERGIDAFNRRDVEALAEVTALDSEWFPALPGAVEGDGSRGFQGIETYLGEIRETWEELQLLADEYRDLGDRVLMLGRQEGLGRGSGVPVDAPIAVMFDLRDGKISRTRSYLDHAEALRAAGLSEEPVTPMPEESTVPDLVQRVRVMFEAIPLRDWDAILAFVAPNAVWESPGAGTFEGHAALRGLWEQFWSSYEEGFEDDLDEVRDFGNGVVLAAFTMRGQLAGSSDELRERGQYLYEWVDDLIVRVISYRDIDEARAAAERLAQERADG